jgi:hypothetical protein
VFDVCHGLSPSIDCESKSTTNYCGVSVSDCCTSSDTCSIASSNT